MTPSTAGIELHIWSTFSVWSLRRSIKALLNSKLQHIFRSAVGLQKHCAIRLENKVHNKSHGKVKWSGVWEWDRVQYIWVLLFLEKHEVICWLTSWLWRWLKWLTLLCGLDLLCVYSLFQLVDIVSSRDKFPSLGKPTTSVSLLLLVGLVCHFTAFITLDTVHFLHTAKISFWTLILYCKMQWLFILYRSIRQNKQNHFLFKLCSATFSERNKYFVLFILKSIGLLPFIRPMNNPMDSETFGTSHCLNTRGKLTVQPE